MAITGNDLRCGNRSKPDSFGNKCSTAGSTFENVPTAPLSLQTATASGAAIIRLRSRSICKCPEGDFHPKRGRFGMHTVGASDHDRVTVLKRQSP